MSSPAVTVNTGQPTLAESFAACRRLAESHYENFTVVSGLLPRHLYDDFAAIYAFCRTADDAADERDDQEQSLRELEHLHRQVDWAAVGPPRPCKGVGTTTGVGGRGSEVGPQRGTLDPFLPALADTIARHDLPADLFHRLLDAFERDQRQNRYETWDDVLSYCTGSADPVGRLVLLVTGHGREAASGLDDMFRYSDATCTALQLTNFWQDVSRDLLERDRIYIPREIMESHGVSEASLVEMVHRRRPGPGFVEMERELVERTRPLFDEGRKLWPLVKSEVRPAIQLFTAGGESILRAIEKQDYDVLSRRPVLGKGRKAFLLARAWIGARMGVGK